MMYVKKIRNHKIYCKCMELQQQIDHTKKKTRNVRPQLNGNGI